MRVLMCLLLLGALGVQDADAQRRGHSRRGRDHSRDAWSYRGPVEFGIRTGYDFDEGVGSAGAQLRIPLVAELHLSPSADVFFEDAGTEWQLNADAVARPDALGGLYLGAGAAFVNRDFNRDGDGDVEAGYNLFLGLDGGQAFHTRVKPFVEARWTDVRDHDPFRLAVGINVPVR